MHMNKIKVTLALTAASILLLFILRLAYGLVSNEPVTQFTRLASCGNSANYNLRNFASKKIQRKSVQAPVFVDQKYEKIATLSSGSGDFSRAEKKLRLQIKSYNALIQYEQRTGLAGRRCLYLAIGIHPEKFESFIATLRTIGTIQKIQINKTDKTNEFKAIKAKKESLHKMQNSLLRLKHHNGQIAEFVKLENRILEIEKEIQKLGVSLGEYDAENEFCTVKFTLAEGSLLAGGGFGSVLLESIGWTIQYGALFGLLLLFFSSAIYIGILSFFKMLPLVLKLWNKFISNDA